MRLHLKAAREGVIPFVFPLKDTGEAVADMILASPDPLEAYIEWVFDPSVKCFCKPCHVRELKEWYAKMKFIGVIPTFSVY